MLKGIFLFAGRVERASTLFQKKKLIGLVHGESWMQLLLYALDVK